MKPIKNFDKLHGGEIYANGNKFLLEIGTDDKNKVWIFDNVKGQGIQEQYCTLMTIDWEANAFDLRKCELGKGTKGKDIELKLTLPIRRCKSMAEFKEFLAELIINEANKRTYKWTHGATTRRVGVSAVGTTNFTTFYKN